MSKEKETKPKIAKWNEYANYTTAIAIGEEKGKAEVREEGKAEVVKNLLAANKFTISEIATYAGVTEGFVEKLKNSLT